MYWLDIGKEENESGSYTEASFIIGLLHRFNFFGFLLGWFFFCLSLLIPSILLCPFSFSLHGLFLPLDFVILPLSQKGFVMQCSKSLGSDFSSPWHISTRPPNPSHPRLDLNHFPLFVSPKIWSCHESWPFRERGIVARGSTCPPDLLQRGWGRLGLLFLIIAGCQKPLVLGVF